MPSVSAFTLRAHPHLLLASARNNLSDHFLSLSLTGQKGAPGSAERERERDVEYGY
jgi:hypothetical protein